MAINTIVRMIVSSECLHLGVNLLNRLIRYQQMSDLIGKMSHSTYLPEINHRN